MSLCGVGVSLIDDNPHLSVSEELLYVSFKGIAFQLSQYTQTHTHTQTTHKNKQRKRKKKRKKWDNNNNNTDMTSQSGRALEVCELCIDHIQIDNQLRDAQFRVLLIPLLEQKERKRERERTRTRAIQVMYDV